MAAVAFGSECVASAMNSVLSRSSVVFYYGGVLSGRVLPAVVNSIPNHTWSHSLPCKEMATPIEVSHRNDFHGRELCSSMNPEDKSRKKKRRESELSRSAWLLLQG